MSEWQTDLDGLVDTRDRLYVYIEGLREALTSIAYCGGEEPVSAEQLQEIARGAIEGEVSQTNEEPT